MLSSYRLRNDLRKSDGGECEIQRELTEFETYLEFAILLVTTPYIYNPLFLMDAGITSLFLIIEKGHQLSPMLGKSS